jgi:hypothetical protein
VVWWSGDGGEEAVVVLEHGVRRRKVGRGALKDGGGSPFYIGRGGRSLV